MSTVIVAGARTPFGRLSGSLKDFSGVDLGAIAIKGALEKAGVPASEVQYVIMGQVLTAGAGQMPARQTAIKAGIGWDVPALSINKMCLSGIDAIALADQLIEHSNQRIAARTAEMYDAMLFLRLGILALVIASLLGLGLYVRQSRAMVAMCHWSSGRTCSGWRNAGITCPTATPLACVSDDSARPGPISM